MTDKELFLKYNNVRTIGLKKDEELNRKLYNGEIKWDKPELHRSLLILLHGSYNCNANCVYCENGSLRKRYNNKVISKETIELLLDKLGPRIREITWHGGEPLTLQEDIIKYLEDLKVEKNLNFETTLQTNSILLTEEKIKFLDDLNITWGTSFDGIYNTRSRGEASTKAILDLISRHPDRVGFISVTYNATINNMIENYEYFKSLGVKNTQACIIREIVLNDDNPLLVSNSVAIKNVLKYIEYWIYDTNNPINDSYVSRHIERVLGETHLCEDSYCLGGWLIVDPDGNLGFCGHSADDGYICNLSDIDSYDNFLYGQKYLSLLGKQIKLEKTCSCCEWYNVCHAACMGLNYEYDHSYNTVNPRNCEFQKGLLNGIYELIKNLDLSDTSKYNPLFLDVLKRCNYYSLDEIKILENGKYSNN